MEIKPTYLGTMIGLATVAFGLIAAGAWNKFISDIDRALPQAEQRGPRRVYLRRHHHDHRNRRRSGVSETRRKGSTAYAPGCRL